MNDFRKTDVERKCLQIYRETLNVADLDVMDEFTDVGGDSTKAVLISTELECAFGIDVSMRTFFEKKNVREMVDWLFEILSPAEGAKAQTGRG